MKHNLYKLITGIALAGFSTVGFSQSSQPNTSKPLNVTAKANAGCLIQTEDFNFGNIELNNLSKYVLEETRNLNLHCSKNITLTITQAGRVNPQQAGYNFSSLTLNNSGIATDSTKVLHYLLMAKAIETNEKFTLLYKHASNNFGGLSAGGQNFSLRIKTLTNDNFSLPLLAQLILYNQAIAYTKSSGNYADTVTYTLSF